MKNMEKLIKKYETDRYVHGAYETPLQDRQRYYKKRLKIRYRILDELLQEAPRLNLNNHEKMRVRYLIEYYNTEFKKLYSRGSDELIILSFIFYIKKVKKQDIRIERWSISKKYNLTTVKFTLIISRMLELNLKHTPIRIKQTTHYDHSILEKTTTL